MFQRLVKLPKNNSFFLFGPRGVGKSWWLQEVLPKEKTCRIDLLDFEMESRLIQNPGAFGEILNSLPDKMEWVFVDEIQKIPPLLNEVHRHIESHPHRHFALTGSSARKLKRGKANLLAGRAFTYHLHSLSIAELRDQFDLSDALTFGTLPKIFSYSDVEDKRNYLKSYVETYLKEEISAEGIVRNLTAFRRFLPLAARDNGQVLSWSNFAQDVGMDVKTIRSYFEILEDTLVGSLLPAYHRSLRKRQKTHPKFYFFDPGVVRALANLLNVPLLPGTYEYGRAFEHYWILEIMRHNDYHKLDWSFSYFATNDIEIDLVIERPAKGPLLIEFKSSERVKNQELSPLIAVVQEIRGAKGICVCREKRERIVEGITVCPWSDLLAYLNSL